MEHGSNSLDLQVSNMHMKMGAQMSSNSESHNSYVSTEKRDLVEPLSTNSGFNMMPNRRARHNESSGGGMGSSPIWMPSQLGCEDATVLNNMAGENALFPVKRKAEVGPLSNNSVPDQSLLPIKRLAHIGTHVNSLGFLQSSAPQRNAAASQSKLGFPGLHTQPSFNKKMVRNDFISGKSRLQQGQTTKKQTAPGESKSKGHPESSEAVRSKMRESLADALALAFQNQDNVPNTNKNHSDEAITTQFVSSQAYESNPTMTGHIPVPGSEEVYPSKELDTPGKTIDYQAFSVELPPNGSRGSGGQSFPEFQYSSGLPDEDVPYGDNFFLKDDLLQENGLFWVFDFDVQVKEEKEAQHEEKLKSVKEEDQGHKREAAVMTPDSLAFKIEAELLNVFGGVNKKYRKKGRSLLFNLKDRNNPELRERVISGEISPEKLCSMSAEELASKELSQWRMAKAEELAQMVVLPDAEVDIRRLVRKTHKGEYQVEVERDDGIAAEVSGGTSLLTGPQPKKETESHSPPEANSKDKEKVAGQGNNSKEQNFSGSVIIPTDGTDMMQGMIVDELKDTGFLPPIVSLDEFVESFNSEPPLAKDTGEKTPISHGGSPKLASNFLAISQASDSPEDASSRKAAIAKEREVDVTIKSSGSPAKAEVPPSSVPKVEYVWDGIIQLNASSSVTVGGLFQSGEKMSTKEWPPSLEVKGRVRLDAFEKFLRELPMSRTRAVMVLQFVLRDKSSNKDRASLYEAIEAYSVDERLGYAELAAGVELYLCPPTARILDMLHKHMPKERPQFNNSTENDELFGVVVWRRAHISNTISPNSSSHHKHSSKKRPSAPSKRVQDSSNANANAPTGTSPPASSESQPQTEEDDDDIPPGFGPTAAAAQAAKDDDDDLPEFNFAGELNTPAPRIPSQNLHHGVKMTQRPVDQVRELIKKYGQSGNSSTSGVRVDDRNLGIEPWEDDDDDDIPEWRPEAPHQLHNQLYPVVPGRPPPHAPLLPTNHRMVPMVTQQSLSGFGHPPPVGRWMQPPGFFHGARWRQR